MKPINRPTDEGRPPAKFAMVSRAPSAGNYNLAVPTHEGEAGRASVSAATAVRMRCGRRESRSIGRRSSGADGPRQATRNTTFHHTSETICRRQHKKKLIAPSAIEVTEKRIIRRGMNTRMGSKPGTKMGPKNEKQAFSGSEGEVRASVRSPTLGTHWGTYWVRTASADLVRAVSEAVGSHLHSRAACRALCIH